MEILPEVTSLTVVDVASSTDSACSLMRFTSSSVRGGTANGVSPLTADLMQELDVSSSNFR